MDIEPIFRPAGKDDIKAIVAMLADDELGKMREDYRDPLPASYYQAFARINADENNELVVACNGEDVIGVAQLTCIPCLTYQGGWRALIEGVRVSRKCRAQGIGRKLFEWLIARARDRGCHMVQLTTDKARSEAVSFYRSLGFVDSHIGMKLHL